MTETSFLGIALEFANISSMSFQLAIQEAIYSRVTNDPTMISLWQAYRGQNPRIDVYMPPNMQFPYICFALKSKTGGDDFTENGQLIMDVWNARKPSETEAFSYAVRERLDHLFNKKIMRQGHSSCRFYFCDKYKKPVLVDGNISESEISCYTIIFDLRVIDANKVNAILNED